MSASDQFDKWLVDQLSQFDTDADAISSYIRGIVEGDETREEKIEALEGIICELSKNDISSLCNDILIKWQEFNEVPNGQKDQDNGSVEIDEQLANLMKTQSISVVTTRTLTDEEKKLKQSILAQYAEVSEYNDDFSEEEEEETKDITPSGIASVDAFLMKNDNASSVVQAEVEKREKNKAESEKKKAQDKLNREKQKEAKQDRKEKEKKRTQKGERRR